MIPFSTSDYLAMQARLEHARRSSRREIRDGLNTAIQAERETGHGGLQEQIMKHCRNQWPKWKFMHARTDKRSGLEEGAEDFTIFLPEGRTLHIETKAKGKKRTPEQNIWAAELRMLGHEVHVCRSIEDFKALAAAEMAKPQTP